MPIIADFRQKDQISDILVIAYESGSA